VNYCHKNGIVFQAFAPLGHSSEPNVLADPVVTSIANRVGKTPAQVLLAWGIQRGTALLTTTKTPSRLAENFEVSTLLRRRHAGDQRRNQDADPIQLRGRNRRSRIHTKRKVEVEVMIQGGPDICRTNRFGKKKIEYDRSRHSHSQ